MRSAGCVRVPVHAGDLVSRVERQHDVERRPLELTGADHVDVAGCLRHHALTDDRRAGGPDPIWWTV
jgi:hypothetical protein